MTIEDLRKEVKRRADLARKVPPRLLDEEERMSIVADTLFQVYDWKGEPHRTWVENALKDVLG